MPDDQPLSREEEALFASLMSDAGDWQLSDGWVQGFLANVEREDGHVGVAAGGVGAVELHDVVDLTTERERRRRPLALVASWVVAILGIGVVLSVVFSGNSDSPGDIAVIPASQEVSPPQVSELDLPEDTETVVRAADGSVVAVVYDDTAGETYLDVTTDLVTWESTERLPVHFPVIDVSTDTWYIVGGDARSSVDFGGPVDPRFSIETAFFASSDRGQTWSEIETISPGEVVLTDEASGVDLTVPFTIAAVFDHSLAVIEDRVLVSYLETPLPNWTEVAREAGLIDDQAVVVMSDPIDPEFFAFGPGTFEPIEISGSDLGLTNFQLDEVLTGSLTGQAQVSVAGGDFEDVEIPRNNLILSVAAAFDDRLAITAVYLRSGPPQSEVFESTDGVSWVESDIASFGPTLFEENEPIEPRDTLPTVGGAGQNDEDQVLVESADWRLRIRDDDDTLIAEQSLVDSDSFSPVPVPAVEAQLVGGFSTDFGAALVWQDNEADSLRDDTTIVVDNGHSFEFFNNDQVTVTDPDGVVLSNRQPFAAIQRGSVLIEGRSNVFVVGDDGDVVAAATFADRTAEFLRSGVRTENPPARFISWASGPLEWSFAPLEGIESALWNFTILDDGIIATALDDPSEALFINWPDEFGE